MEAPAFTRTGVQTTRAAPGSEACIALPLPTGTPPFTYEWSRAGATLDGRFRTSVDAGGVRLTVSSAQIGDSGVYTLQATNAAGKDTTRVSLEVSPDETPTGEDPPTFLRRLQDLTVKVGTRTRFLVEILSSTECKVTWYRNERRLLEAERIALVRDGNFWCADVATVSVDDAGRWTCTAENLGGRASCSAHLNVLVPKAYKRPEFVEELRAILTEQGTVSLECKVIGVPTPVLRWFKDSREIKAGDVFALTANADDPTSLGTYTCEAINCMGRAYSSSKVHVIGRSKEGSDKPSFGGLTPDPPPIFTKELEDQFVRICDHLSLGCQIVVPPWPRSVVWYNKEGKIDSSTKYHIIEDGVGGYMIEISPSEWADEGEWKCVATSAGGRVGISTCSVTMDVPKNYRKPRFMENLQAILTEEGLVSFECKVVGFPTPVLSWFKDGQELKPGDVYQLTGTNSLGSYCCIARNCMGQASSSAELTVEDIQNQLNEEEKLQLFSKNQAPKFLQGLKSVEVKIDEPFRFTIKVVIPPEPTVLWYRDDQPMDESPRCHLENEDRGVFCLDIKNLELMDQTEWKCVAMNDYGHSVTSCFLKLIIPRHYKKPRFLENLQAILSDEGAVNLECKVIGVPQPVLKWYKDGEELKPGDIHRIISGQDGTCCLGTYTCEAQNCMGIAASSASLLGFEDTVKAKKKRADDQILQRNLSLSTIHEERTSQMYDTPMADVTLDERGEISFSFDGKEVSVSLYETPDLTEEEALQIVEMYADQLSENVTEHNVIELPPLRFVKETSTSGNLLMEAIIIDVSPDYFVSPEEDLRTEADIEDISIVEENGQAQLSFDQEIGDDYIEKTMALLSDEKSDIPLKLVRRKSDSQKSGEDYFSLSRDQSLSEEKKDDDTQMLSESVSFASAHSTGKQKSKPSQEDEIGTHESSDITKTVLLREELRTSSDIENKASKVVKSTKRDSLKSITSFKQEEVDITNLSEDITFISSSLSTILNNIQILEKDIILQSQLMSTAAIASKSLEIINSIINPLTEIHSITDAFKESLNKSCNAEHILLTKIPQCLKDLQNSLAMVEKCVDVGSDKTLINNTCISIINHCEEDITKFIAKIQEIPEKYSSLIDETVSSEIKLLANDILNTIDISKSIVATKCTLRQEIKKEELSIDKQHLNNTQKAIYNLKVPVNSLLDIIENALKKSPLTYNETNNAEVILFNMSSSIQDLQTALEQIEFLSVEESNSSLQKYNTETIETVIGSVLKLRNSFESLSSEKEKKYDKEQLQNVLQVIKVDLEDITSRINNIERTIGPFDVLYGDNKLEILQRMAHVLISLENSMPLLSSLPNVQITLSAFHKNLTKALENAIESNESAKYSALLHICDVVSRINVSIKGFESSKFLSLTSIGNNLNIIEDNLKHLCVDQGISEDILKNVYQYYLDIQNVITTDAEVKSIQMDSEPVEAQIYTESKTNLVVQQIDQVIAVINNISPEEVTVNLSSILPILQNTCPVLEELKYSVACLEQNIIDNSHVSDMSQSLLEQSIGTPLQAIQENITVLNQVLLETVKEGKPKDDAISIFAKPLYELYTTLQTLQENVLSEYESFSLNQNSAKVATSAAVLQSCILIVEEQCNMEGVDEISTLQEISCLKTTADQISEQNLILPLNQETVLEAPIVYTSESQPISKQTISHEFQLLHDDILEIQKLDILEALNTLSEVKEYANIKSVTETIEEIQHKIVSILSPLVMESLSSVSNLDLASNNLPDISESLLKLKNHLTVIDVDNIPIYEDVLKIPSNKVHSIVKNISNLKEHLDKCLLSVRRHSNFVDSKEVKELCKVCDDFVSCSKTTAHTDPTQEENMFNLVSAVENFLQVIKNTPDLNAEEFKKVSKNLHNNIMKMEDTLFEYVSPTDTITEENPLVTKIHILANNVAVLEHYNTDISSTSITDFPQFAYLTPVETEILSNMENVFENDAIIIQNLTNQSQNTEFQNKDLINDLFQKFKNSFSVIRVILKQRPSHKKVIRLFQEYFTLQNIIKKLKDETSKLNRNPKDLIDLENFLKQAESSLEKIKISFIRVSSSLSKTLFREPLAKINDSIVNFPNYLKLDSIMDLHDLIQNFLISVSIAAPHLENLEQYVIQELETCIFINSDAENKLITESLDNLLSLLEREICDKPNEKKEILLKDMIKCFKNHQDYKNAEGTGKRMIILKCLADCSEILRKQLEAFETEIKSLESTQRGSLYNSLTNIIQQLKSFNLEINEMQENSESMTLKSLDTVFGLKVQNILSLKKSFEKQLNVSHRSSLCENDLCLINDIICEIHTIQDNINTIQNDAKIFEDLKDIEDFFNKMLLSHEGAEDHKLTKAETKSILQHVEQYIEVTEIIEEISAIINLGNVKETKEIAQELRESLAADNEQSLDASAELQFCTVSESQENLAQRLQKSLPNIQESELLSCDTHVREHILEVITQLQDDLNAIASTEKIAESSGMSNDNTKSQVPGLNANENFSQNIELLSINIDQECNASDLSIKQQPDRINAIPVIHQIECTISCISGIVLEEIPIEIKNVYPVLENICPILEEIKLSVASLQEDVNRTESPISDISDRPVEKAFSKPLRDLEENIIVLNQLILESCKGTAENEDVHNILEVLAKPLHELHITYQILQENVISQYESLSSLRPNINFATTEQMLHSCVLLVQEPHEVEFADEMSTLEDISCIKTTADSISTDVLAIAQDTQVTTEEYCKSHKQNIPESEELFTVSQPVDQIIIKENIENVEQPLQLEHDMIQETISVSIDADIKTKDKEISDNIEQCNEFVDVSTKNQVSTEDSIKSKALDQALAQETIDEDLNGTETVLTETIEESVATKEDSPREIQVPIEECIENKEENVCTISDEPIVPEQAAVQETQAVLEKRLETSEVSTTLSIDYPLTSEKAMTQKTIDEHLNGTETVLIETIQESFATKEDSPREIQVPIEECIENKEENVCKMINEPIAPEQAAVQETQALLDKCIETSEVSTTLSFDDPLTSEKAMTQKTLVEDLNGTKTVLTETIEESVVTEEDSPREIQVPKEECIENKEENICTIINEPIVHEQAAVQETQAILEKCLETSEVSTTLSFDDSLTSEKSVTQKTKDEVINSTETVLTETIEESVATKEDDAREIQVPIEECIENKEENVCTIINEPFVPEQATVQETQAILEKCIETSEVSTTLSIDDPLKSEKGMTQKTIDEDLKSTEAVLTKTIEESVATKEDDAREIQVPIEECIENKEENVCTISDETIVPEQAIVQETQPVLEKCIETSEVSTTLSIDDPLTSEKAMTPKTIDEDLNSTETVLTKTIEESVATKEDDAREIQVPIEECIENKEENVCKMINETIVPEQAAVQETQAILEKCLETSEVSTTLSLDDPLKSEKGMTQKTIDEDLKSTEAVLTKTIQESVATKEDDAREIQVPIEECIENKEENVCTISDETIVPEQAIVQETQPILEKCIETSEVSTTLSIDDPLTSEKAMTPKTIDEDLYSTETVLTKTIEESVATKEDDAREIQVPIEECIENKEENVCTISDEPIVPEQAAVQETQALLDKCIETSEVSTTLSIDDPLTSEKSMTPKTIDEDLNSKKTVLTKTIQESVATKEDHAREIQVPIEECIENKEENVCKMINETIVPEQAAVQETQAILEKCLETSEVSTTLSLDDPLTSEKAVTQKTIDEDLNSTEAVITKTIEESVATKDDAREIQVPIEECIENREENVCELIDQPFVPKQDDAQEVQATFEKCLEICKENISTPTQLEVVQETQSTVEKDNEIIISDTTDEKSVPDAAISQKSHAAPDVCKEQTTNVQFMEQKSTEYVDEDKATFNASDNLSDIESNQEILAIKDTISILTDINHEVEHNNIIPTMDSLLNELQENLSSSSVTNVEKTDSLQNILDEFQVQIIKLKTVNIKDTSDTLNETIEDLECSVRSVQLLVTENSPTDQVIEASATIELLVNSIKEDINKTPFPDNTTAKTGMLEECVDDTETTLLLLDKVSETPTNHDDILKIITDLNTVKDTIKTIKASFSIDEETVIEKGIEILQSLDIIEHQLFSIEGALEIMPKLDSFTRDTILTAVHSVYTNISNIRGTISNIKKSYIYQNYGKPSENLLKSIKYINYIKSIDNNPNWISVTKHFRNILNHFEEIKFYINLDKTARQPSDASLTKVVLNELKLLLTNVVLTNIKEYQLPLENNVYMAIEYVEECIQKLDRNPILEVREKIPIFKGLTKILLELTNKVQEKYKCVSSLTLGSDEKDSQSNEISTSMSQHSLDKQIILEAPVDDSEGVTTIQSISPLNLNSTITTESSSLENYAPITEIQTDKCNDLENDVIKNSVQPIIEDLIEQAINSVILLNLDLEDKEDLETSLSQVSHDHKNKTLLDAIEIKSQTKSAIELMKDIDKEQDVAEDSQIYQQIKNIVSCKEENLMLDQNIQQSADEDHTSKHLSKEEVCINDKLEKDITQKEYPKDSRSQDTDFKCLDEALVIKDNQVNKDHEDSKKTFDVNCKNIQEESLVSERSKNEDNNNYQAINEDTKTLSHNDSQIHDITIEKSTATKIRSEIKNSTDEELNTVHCEDNKKVEKISQACTSLHDMKAKETTPKIGKVSSFEDPNNKTDNVDVDNKNNLEQSKTESIKDDEKIMPEIQSNDTETNVTTNDNNKIIDNKVPTLQDEELKEHDTPQPELKKDDFQNEIQDTSKNVNKVSKPLERKLDEKLVIEKGTLNEDTIQKIDEQPKPMKKRKPKLNDKQQQLLTTENLNSTKDEMTISNVEGQILQAVVSEENITNLQKDSKTDKTLSTNLVDKDDVPIYHVESIDIEIDNHNLISEDKQESTLEINTISQTEKYEQLSSEEKISCPSIQGIEENISNLEPEEIQQNMDSNKHETGTDDRATNNERMNINTIETATTSLFAKPSKSIENTLSDEINADEELAINDVISSNVIITAQPGSYDSDIISTDENASSTSSPQQNKRIIEEVDAQKLRDIDHLNQEEASKSDQIKEQTLTSSLDTKECILNREIDNNVIKEESKPQVSEPGETNVISPSKQKKDSEAIEPSSQSITSNDTQGEKSKVKKKKGSQSKLKTNGLPKKMYTEKDQIEIDTENNNNKEDHKKAGINDNFDQLDNTDTQCGDIVAVSEKTPKSLSIQILDNNIVKTEMNNIESVESRDAKTPYTVREKPQFIDPNVDSSMEFPRPPGYVSKSFDTENFLAPEVNTYSSTSNVFYKAKSLVRDHQIKSTYTGDHDKQLETQLRTKAVSESRSIYSEKRASSIRDLKRKPVFTTHLTNRTAVEGSRVKLTCSVLSSTEPVLKWYKNGVLLEDKHKYKIKFIDGLITMELLNALPSDSADYSCTVENEHGSITTSAKLKVYPSFEASPIPPTFTRSIRDVYHRAENELVLECRIRGQPLPTISWFKDNNQIVTDDRYEASYLADGLCRLTINSPTKEDSGTYTCKAESAVWSDQITHVVNFADTSRLDSRISSVERLRLSHDTRRPHFTNVLSDYKVIKGGTIGLQVEIGGAPTRVEWLREGSSVTELDMNAQTFVDHGIYTLALNDVSEKHSGLYTCRAWSTHGNVDMNAEISVVQPNEVNGRPAVIVSRPAKDVLISVGEDINISFRVQGEPKPKVFFLKGIRDITNSQRVCKMTSDDYVKFTMKRSVISDAGTYCILARNVYGCDRAFVTVVVRQRASSDNLISDWTYPADDPSIVATDRKYKSVPGRIPGEPSAVDGGNNWVALAWPKSDPQEAAPVLAYRVDSWLLGKEGGARWMEMGITPRNTFDAFNLKQGEEYHFRVTPRNRYGWGEPVQTSNPIGVGIAGDRPEFIDILPGLLKVLVDETANLSCSFKGKPTPEIVWMKNGREIEESAKVKSRQSGNVCSLKIENVEIEDEGRYSCEATNAHGRASTYARMTVITDRQIWEADAKLKRERSAGATGEYPPQFTMRLRDRRVQATYPVRLTCQVIGSPSPNVTWFKDGQEITFDSRKTSYQDEHFHTLEIAPTTLDDGGLYEALARNNSGAVSCRCSLVVDKGIRAYVAPEFCCGLEPLYRLNEGDELRVSAIVEAYPSVGVTWYRDGVRLRPSRRAIMTLDRDGQIELALASVTPRDAGVYTCTASNEVGQASTSGKVEIVTDPREERRNLPTVICPDVPYSKEPMFIKKPRSTEAQEGDTVIIECEVIGDPTPEVYWLRDFLKPDYYRDAIHFKQMAAGPLYRFEIPHAKLDFTGAYSVVARNIHGEAKAIISLQIFAKDLRSSDETHNIRYGRVEVIPRFEKELTDLLCYDSDAIEFECLVSGNPEPDIRWFHYNQLLPDCPDFESTYDLGTARLKIKQVAAEDEGTYTCEASNNLGKASSSACLVVYPPGEPNTLSQRLQRPPAFASAVSTPRSTPRVTPARSVSRTPARSGPESRRLRSPTREVGPKFYTYPFNKVVEEGDSVVLQCAVGGLPTPWATWDKDGIIITPTSRISVKEKDEMLRILQIDEVNVDDVGLYRITLENDFGRAEASARLEVISHKGKFHSRSSSISPARLYRRRTPSFTRQD